MRTRIIFRADGNSRIGLGHVMRSLALVQMLKGHFECVFAIQNPEKELLETISNTCDGIIVLPACENDASRFTYELNAYIDSEVIVVLDGYFFDTAYQNNIKSKGCSLLCIDDIHAYKFVADAVLNQAGGIQDNFYKTAPYTKLLLGPAYALLRRPFLEAAKADRLYVPDCPKAFVNLGGADPDNHTLRLVKELNQHPVINSIEIVIGSAYRHLIELETWVKENKACKLHKNLESEEMCLLMQQCMLGFTSASGVSYEYAAVGGLLFVQQTADNQQDIYNFLTEREIAHKYEDLNDVLFGNLGEAFDKQVKTQRQYIDGESDKRILNMLVTLEMATKTSLRKVTADDLELLFNWANDPEVRKRSFNPNLILFESHKRWLSTKLNSAEALLYILEVDSIPAAHVRFELNGDSAVISYLIGEKFRGKGFGHIVLQHGINKLAEEMPAIEKVEALVQKDNTASIRILKKVGFNDASPDPTYPQAYRFELTLEQRK